MPLEVEARFRAPDAGPVARLTDAPTLGAAKLGPPSHALETDRYLDTVDGRLAAERWACRLRSRGDETRVSLKGPAERGSAGWLHRRPEIEGPAFPVVDPSAWPESEALTFLLELSGGATLTERLRLNQQRTERQVILDGAALGTLSLDVVEVEGRGSNGGYLLIVELELAADSADDALPALTDALVTLEPTLVPEPLTKLELALGLLA